MSYFRCPQIAGNLATIMTDSKLYALPTMESSIYDFSMVLDIDQSPVHFRIVVERASDKNDDRHCLHREGKEPIYELKELVFKKVRKVTWLRRCVSHTLRPDGMWDFGNIYLSVENGSFWVRGAWGDVKVLAEKVVLQPYTNDHDLKTPLFFDGFSFNRPSRRFKKTVGRLQHYKKHGTSYSSRLINPLN